MLLSRMTIVLALVACGEKTVDEDVVEEVVDVDGDGVEESLDCDDSDGDLGAIAEDTDCDGFLNEDDCGPEDADIYPDAEDAWYDGVDSNCDGADDFDQDGDGEASADYDGTDCDDEDDSINTAAEEIWYDGIDQNCDGLSDYDQDGDGVENDSDCDDTDASISPQVIETWYDGIDQNCDGLSDYDQDADGEDSSDHGGADCDDTDATINTSATDTWYDGVDSNCDGANDYDQDGDGEESSDHGGTDCDDMDTTINTGVAETWYDGVDSNCDGLSDYDQDADGEDSSDHGGADCNDTDATVYSTATEVWYDGVDQNCDGANDYDQDGDSESAVGYSSFNGCFEFTLSDSYGDGWNGNSIEVYEDGTFVQSITLVSGSSGTEQYCPSSSGQLTEWYFDDGLYNNEVSFEVADSSGTVLATGAGSGTSDIVVNGVTYSDGDMVFSYALSGADCDDTDATINTSATDTWYDGVDSNCDGANDYDQDGDGFGSLFHLQGVDCNDNDASINPNAADDTFDGIDNDCDGQIDEDASIPIFDNDGDGVFSINDCDDNDPTAYPGATEYCDAVDHDCDGVAYQPGLVTQNVGGTLTNLSMQTTPNGGSFSSLALSSGDIEVCAGTYYSTLSINTTSDFSINGHGSVVFDGQNANPLLHLYSTSSSGTNAVSVDGISFENGYNDFYVDELVTGSGSYVYTGGALTCNPDTSEIDLTLTNLDFTNNVGGSGGAIYAHDCAVYATNVTVQNNEASNDGGGMYINSGELEMDNSTVSNNTSVGSGGGIEIYAGIGANYINASYIEGNETTGSLANGGGIYASLTGLNIQSTTVGNNEAYHGGGIFSEGSTIHLSDMALSNNTANLGGAIYLFDGNFSTPRESFVTCGGNSALKSAIVGNTSNGLGIVDGGAIHVEENTFFHSTECFLGGNNGYDLVQESGNWVQFNASLQHSKLYGGSSVIGYEDCTGTSDLNGNGDVGYEDAYCTMQPGRNFLSTQQLHPATSQPSCSTTSTSNTQVSYGDMYTSACVTTEVVSYSLEQEYFLETMQDFQEIDCQTVQPTFNPGHQYIHEQFIARSSELEPKSLSTKIGVPEGVVANIEVNYTMDFGHDCDGNCCYDVFMTDSWGDGWDGAYLEVYEGFSLIETLTLDNGSEGWQTFCIEDGFPFFLEYNNTNQGYDDTETFILMQGNSSGGSDIVCTSASDLSPGRVDECDPNNVGVMFCQ